MDGKYIIIIADEITVNVFKLLEGVCQETAKLNHDYYVSQAEFNFNSTHLITFCYNIKLQIFNINIWQVNPNGFSKKAIISHDTFIYTTSFSPTGIFVVTAIMGGDVKNLGKFKLLLKIINYYLVKIRNQRCTAFICFL